MILNKNTVLCQLLALVSKLLTIFSLNSHQSFILIAQENILKNANKSNPILAKTLTKKFFFLKINGFNDVYNVCVKNMSKIALRLKKLLKYKKGKWRCWG